MDENEWEVSSDLAGMLYHAQNIYTKTATGFSVQTRTPLISNRKLQLFACACCLLNGTSLKQVDEYELTGPPNQDDMESDTAEVWARRWTDYSKRATQKQKANALRDIVGNPFTKPLVWVKSIKLQSGGYHHQKLDGLLVSIGEAGKIKMLDAAWLTHTVVSLAQAAYDERLPNGTLDPYRLLVLADALEEVGCDPYGPLTWHLRGRDDLGWYQLNRPHWRGCWAVDLLLHKK